MSRKHCQRALAGTLLFGAVACGPPPELIQGEDLLVLQGATLIDGSGGEPIPSSAVVVEDGRVLRIGVVGDFDYPDETEVVDLEGRWLLPGFIEMHAHLPTSAEARADTLRAYLRYGVTTVADPATSEAGLALKSRDFDGTMPRVFSAGRVLNGPSFASIFDNVATLTSVEG